MTDPTPTPDELDDAKAPELTYNQAGTHVHVHNPTTGGDWECPVDYLPVATQTGWVPSTPPDTSLAGLFDPGVHTTPVAEETGFDPASTDVDGVNEHLGKHAAASPGEVARVLELEANGKNRKGIVNGPFAPESDPVDGDSADGTNPTA